MENWGLVTYRETSLLYNPATSAILDQDWVGVVIAHELSHQWFGDLVTMKWWNDLWLNEGAFFDIFSFLEKIFIFLSFPKLLGKGFFDQPAIQHIPVVVLSEWFNNDELLITLCTFQPTFASSYLK